jgi:hypothetical protein
MKIIASPNVKQNWAALGSRKGQLWLLIIMSALTMTVPYFIQGALSGGLSPAQIAADVWSLDQRAWAIRAVVEGLVIAYISRTNAKTRRQGATLWALEIALIALIAVTLGPTLYAAMNGVKMAEALSPDLQWWWAFALASYMPLMVLGASYAYRVQPEDALQTVATDVQTVANETQQKIADLQMEIATMQKNVTVAMNRVGELQAENATAQANAKQARQHAIELEGVAKAAQQEVAELRADAKLATVIESALQKWAALTLADKVRWIVNNCNERPAASDLAKALQCSVSTVTRIYAEVQNG